MIDIVFIAERIRELQNASSKLTRVYTTEYTEIMEELDHHKYSRTCHSAPQSETDFTFLWLTACTNQTHRTHYAILFVRIRFIGYLTNF